MTEESGHSRHRLFIERLVIAIAIIAVALVLWELRWLVLLAFGSVLVAVILNLIARPLHERLRLHHGVSLAVAVLVVLGLFAMAFTLFGGQVAGQSTALRDVIPQAWDALLQRLEPLGLAEPLRGLGSGEGIVSRVGSFAMSVGSGIADFILVLVGGVYLAAQPTLYRHGLAKLVPRGGRGLTLLALDDAGKALRLWLIGRLAAMAIVGLLTGFGLWLLGVPAALTLGILAALLDFVPYIGPIIAAVPAILIALTVSPELALWTAGLYLIVQQVEGNIVDPIVQQKAVYLPPALLLFSLFAGGLLFGMAGVILAAPLTVVLFVMVKRLYVREALHTPTPMPTEED